MDSSQSLLLKIEINELLIESLKLTIAIDDIMLEDKEVVDVSRLSTSFTEKLTIFMERLKSSL